MQYVKKPNLMQENNEQNTDILNKDKMSITDIFWCPRLLHNSLMLLPKPN